MSDGLSEIAFDELPLPEYVELLGAETARLRAENDRLRHYLGHALRRLQEVEGNLPLAIFDAQEIIRDALRGKRV